MKNGLSKIIEKAGKGFYVADINFIYNNGEIYFALTNNSAANRTPTKVDAANPRAYNDLDGKKGSGNPNGHIIRFR